MITPPSRAESPIILPNNNPPVGRIQAIIDRIVAAVQWFFGLCFPCCRPAHMDLLADFSRDEQLIAPDLNRPLTPVAFLLLSPPPAAATAAPARPAPPSPPPAEAASARTPSPPPRGATEPPARPAPPSPPPAAAAASPTLFHAEAATQVPEIVLKIRTSSDFSRMVLTTTLNFELNLPSTIVIIARNPNTFRRAGFPLVQAQREHNRLTTAYRQILTDMVEKVSSPHELFCAVQEVGLSVDTAAASLASQAQDGETDWPQLDLQSELANLVHIAFFWLQLDCMSKTLPGNPLQMAGIFFKALEPARRIQQMPDSMRTRLIPLYNQSSRIMEDWNWVCQPTDPDYQPFVEEVRRISRTLATIINCEPLL